MRKWQTCLLAVLDVLSLALFLFRCWEEIVESPFWWIIKTPILVSILVKYQHILLAAKPSLSPNWGGVKGCWGVSHKCPWKMHCQVKSHWTIALGWEIPPPDKHSHLQHWPWKEFEWPGWGWSFDVALTTSIPLVEWPWECVATGGWGMWLDIQERLILPKESVDAWIPSNDPC